MTEPRSAADDGQESAADERKPAGSVVAEIDDPELSETERAAAEFGGE
jgi:hypothetical protein